MPMTPFPLFALVGLLSVSSAAWAAESPRPADPDRDEDGLSDFQELHKYGTDPERADSDGDGVGDGDWDERREFAYSVRTVVRVLRPVDVAAANDDYQDARLRAEHDEWVELEVVHYPLGTAGDAIGSDPDWRERVSALSDYLESTPTSSFDRRMQRELADELRARGVELDTVDDRTLATETARQLMERSGFEDGFTTFLADFRRGRPVVPPDLKAVVRNFERERGISIEQQWERELFARGMFEQRVHGSCTSSAIYLCGGLRAAGVPTRIVLSIPIVDANDPEQLALVSAGIRHHRVRATALKGLRPLVGTWASHTFNEVFVDGRWRRLNYTRLGQPILDEGLYGLTTHVLTVRDWADARMGRTVGRRQGLGLRDDVFRTANPYATLEVSDSFGPHADIDNPLVAEPPRIEQVTIARAFWVASPERPPHVDVSRVDPATDRHHVVLYADARELPDGEALGAFWDSVPKAFRLVAADGASVGAEAVRGFWWGRQGDEPYLYYLLRLSPEAREALTPQTTYALVPAGPAAPGGAHFAAAEGLAIVGR